MSCALAVGSFKKGIEALWLRCGLRELAEEAWGKRKEGYVSDKIQTTSCPHGPLLATFHTSTALHNQSIFFFNLCRVLEDDIIPGPKVPKGGWVPHTCAHCFSGTNAGHSIHSQLLISHGRQMTHRGEEDGPQDHTIKRRPDPRISEIYAGLVRRQSV